MVGKSTVAPGDSPLLTWRGFKMEEVEKIKEYLKDLILVMANRAEKEVDALMPGYTHVQVRCEM